MKHLLDTQIFLWSLLEPERLRPTVIEDLLENPNHALYLSAASVWEITIKWAKGRLTLPDAPRVYVPAKLAQTGVQPLAVSHWHTLAVGELPPHHADPFDRLIIAQAQHETMTIITSDPLFEAYQINQINVDKYKRRRR